MTGMIIASMTLGFIGIACGALVIRHGTGGGRGTVPALRDAAEPAPATGEPEARRVVIGVSGSWSSLAALRRGCELAGALGRTVVAVVAWSPPQGEAAYRQAPYPPLVRMWERQAAQRLAAAFDSLFGGVPRGLRVERLTARAPAAYALCAVANREDDILVIGAGGRGLPGRALLGRTRRRVLARARCPVVTVPALAAPRGVRRALRRALPADFAGGRPGCATGPER